MPFGTGKYRYELVDGWAKYPQGDKMLDAVDIAIDAQDRVYVLTRGNHPVMIFDRDGNLLSTWGEGLFRHAHGICFDRDGSVFCTDDENHTVRKFTPEGKLLLTLGTEDKPSDTGYVRTFDLYASIATITRGGGPFNRPTGVAIASTGEILVSDGYGNARVHRFSPDGEWLHSWGGPGADIGQFHLPHNIWIDGQDRVWVPDRENSRIQIFDTSGKFLSQWNQLIRPTDLCMDAEDRVYICDLAERVNVYTIEGELLSQWSAEGLNREQALFIAPHAVAVDSRGDLYVGEVAWTGFGIDRGPRAIQKFARIS
jgi:sugar lactone lactonase YvrE